MNALLAGDESAQAVGVRTTRLRTLLLVCASLLTGSIVAVSGGIGFVGLVVPHIARLLVGRTIAECWPVTVLGRRALPHGGRSARPHGRGSDGDTLGILTAFVGAPFFLWLMRSGGERAGFDR